MAIEDVAFWNGDGVAARLLIAYARRVPPHPFKIRWFRWMARHVFPMGLRVVNRAGVRMRVDPLDYIGHEICFSKAYEPRSIALAARLMSDGGTFLDVGANFGLYTCTVAALPGVRCIAVDAAASALDKLQRNLALSPDANVQVVTAALGDKRGIVRIETPVVDNLGTTRVASATSVDVPQSNFVAETTLDEVLRCVRADRIKLMKIDVEGYELTVFKGMDLNAPYRPEHILMEYSDRIVTETANLRACYELLSANGYEAFSVADEPFLGVLPLPEENLWWRHRDAG
ncbi:FkbM family methyltransferase [Cognatilysobacter lacus]|uniref:FkbM family methyltransferase n=1 Tax=Cognatilysobacter lacus TaxID=1643323 RepID=A0A5D8YX53_9GAMM|nr:FkbM family methyltransferase [Lysobacter lacus]TZF87298.1 FkbM family methyltransferase [Lysobacter lacus]